MKGRIFSSIFLPILLLVMPVVAPAQEITVDAPYVDPYEGMWMPVGEPGSGLVIDQQDDTLVVTVFTYREDGSPAWYLAAGKIQEGVFEETAREYAGGSCLNCPWEAAEEQDGGISVRLDFVNHSNAWLTWDDGEPIPLRFLAFALDDQMIWSVDTPFGSPRAPHMIGRWVFVPSLRDSGQFPREAVFESSGFLDPGGIFWSATGDPFNGGVECLIAQYLPNTDETACRLTEFFNEGFLDLAAAHWGDIGPIQAKFYEGDPVPSEDGIRGDELVLGFRLTGPLIHPLRNETGETHEAFDPARHLEKGMWTIPGEPGSGVMIDWQDETLVYVIFTYDEEGNPVWLQGSGLLGKDSTVGSGARRFTGGTCLNCNYADSHEAGAPLGVRLEFHSKTTGTMRFDGGDPMPIRALAFDSPRYREFDEPGEFGQPAIYDLRGEWVFVGARGMETFFQRVDFVNPVEAVGDHGAHYGWQGADGHLNFVCREGLPADEKECLLFTTNVESVEILLKTTWENVGEDQIIGRLVVPEGSNRDPASEGELVFGFRLNGPSR